jgi:hypothetical protein
MFTTTTPVLLAESGVGPEFSDVSMFTGMQIVSTGPNVIVDTREQLILATNNGLFHSTASQAGALIGIADATPVTGALNQTSAVWRRFQGTENVYFVGVSGANPGYGQKPEARPAQGQIGHGANTVWAFGAADDGTGTFERGRVYQTSVDANDAGTTPTFVTNGFDPLEYNASNPNGTFNTLPFMTNFWSDGGRRFLCTIPTFGAKQALQAGTWNNARFCQTALASFADEPAFATATSINCVTTTGYAGELVVGTDKGVVALR